MSQSVKKRNIKVSTILTILVSVFAALLIVTVAALGYFYSRISSTTIHNGVTVGGIDVGGLSKFEAAELLESTMSQRDTDFTVTTNNKVQTVNYADVNAKADLKTAVENAYNHGRTGGMFQRFYAIIIANFGGADYFLPFNFDSKLADKLCDSIIDNAQSDFENSSYEVVDNALVVNLGKAGTVLDADMLRNSVINNIQCGLTKDLTFTLTVREPDPLDFEKIRKEIECEPSNAVLHNEDLLNPYVTPEVYGIRLDQSQVDAVMSQVDGSKSTYTIPLVVTEPDILSSEVGYREPFSDVLAHVTTSLNVGNKPRTKNVELALSFVNGKILMPGEEFSYNDVVGERTYERGFKDAKIYVSGEVVDGIGGGICQVSTTLYMAALRADLEITSRRNHRFTVDYAPLGEDATVVYGQVDFKFRNNTEYPIRIDCELKDQKVDLSLMGNQVTENKEVKLETKVLSKTPFQTVTEYDETLAPDQTKTKNGGYTGYKTETYRVVYIDGKEVSRTFENKSTYTKLDKVILSGTDPNATVNENPNENPDVLDPNTNPSTPQTPEENNPVSEMPDWLRPRQTTPAVN